MQGRAAAAEFWNEQSRAWWRELNRRAKLRADRAVKRLGYGYNGGLLVYEWELHPPYIVQSREG